MEEGLKSKLMALDGPVLVTGHTGFKGTWITLLLQALKIPVVGYSLEPEVESLFARAGRKGIIPEVFDDIRNYDSLSRCINDFRPSAIIHMAAQSLVLESYLKPRYTFEVNLLGTTNVLDLAFRSSSVSSVLVVTSDKVYKNKNFGLAFKEDDELRGKDPYSASKVATESAVDAWRQISKTEGGPKVISVRAGNVIGGGDYAENRLLPDVVRSTLRNKPAEIRNPRSVRPWQHVLDPIYGYLKILADLNTKDFAESFNFGPDEYLEVSQVIEICKKHKFCHEAKFNFSTSEDLDSREAQLLKLDSTRARNELNWKPKFNTKQSIELTLDWWEAVSLQGYSAQDRTEFEVQKYLDT